MKILQLAKYHPNDFGGIERLVKKYSEVISKCKNKCDVICFRKGGSTKIELLEKYNIFSCRTIFTVANAPFSSSLIYLLYKVSNNYDLIHVHLPNPGGLFALYLISKFKKIKYSIHFHAEARGLKFYFFYKFLENYFLQKSVSIITTSDNLANSPTLNTFKNKITVIPSTIAKIDFSFSKSLINKRLLSISNQKYLIFVGRFTKYKNLNLLIDSFINVKIKYRDLKLLICGNGSEYISIKKKIDDLGFSKEIKIILDPNDNEKKFLLQNALFSLFPATTVAEAFGLSQLESMALGTPVISFDILHSGVSFINKHKKTGYVIKNLSKTSTIHNKEKLTQAITFLMENMQDLEKMREECISWAKKFVTEAHQENINNFFLRNIND